MSSEFTELNEPSVPPPPAPPAPAPERPGLAIAALTLGVVSIVLSVVLLGGLVGVAGAILALAHFIRRPHERRGMAVAGLVLSFAGVVASAGFGVFYYKAVGNFLSLLNGGDAQKWVGVRSPDFTVTTLDGETFRLSDFRGRRVIVDLWATWCGPCLREAPHFNRLRNTISEDDLALVGISDESESVLRPFLKTHSMQYPVASSRNLPEPYSKIQIIPTTIFIDRNGVIQSVLFGYQEFDVLREHSTARDYAGEPKPPPSNTAEP